MSAYAAGFKSLGVIARARKRTIPSTWKGNRKGQGRVCGGQYPGGPMNPAERGGI